MGRGDARVSRVRHMDRVASGLGGLATACRSHGGGAAAAHCRVRGDQYRAQSPVSPVAVAAGGPRAVHTAPGPGDRARTGGSATRRRSAQPGASSPRHSSCPSSIRAGSTARGSGSGAPSCSLTAKRPVDLCHGLPLGRCQEDRTGCRSSVNGRPVIGPGTWIRQTFAASPVRQRSRPNRETRCSVQAHYMHRGYSVRCRRSR